MLMGLTTTDVNCRCIVREILDAWTLVRMPVKDFMLYMLICWVTSLENLEEKNLLGLRVANKLRMPASIGDTRSASTAEYT